MPIRQVIRPDREIFHRRLIYFLSLLITSLICLVNCKEDNFNNEFHNDVKIHGVDGLIVEIDKENFFKMMKKINYAIVFIYNPKICRLGIECKEILEEYKKATEKLFKLTPAVGLFKIKCSFLPNQIENDFCQYINITEENIPQLMFLYYGNYILLDKFNPIFAKDIINTMENKIYLTTVTELNNKRSIKTFFEQEKIIDNKMNLHSMKFILYSNKIYENTFTEQNKNNNTEIDFNKVQRNSEALEKIFINSKLFSTFKAYRIINKRTLQYFVDYTLKKSHYIVKDLDKIKADNYKFLEEHENLVITFHISEDIYNEDFYHNKLQENELKNMKILNFSLNKNNPSNSFKDLIFSFLMFKKSL